MKHSLLLLALCLQAACPPPSANLQAQDFGFDILGLQNEDFFQAPTSSNAQISPDGEHLVYTRKTFDGDRIHLLDLESGKDRVLQEPNLRHEGITHISWANNQRIVFQNHFGNLYSRDIESGLRELIFDSKRSYFFLNAFVRTNATFPRVLSTLPDDPDHILISAYDREGIRRVYKLPLEKWGDVGFPEPLFKRSKDFDSWYADQNGQVRLAFKSSPRGFTLYQRVDTSESWKQMKTLLKASGSTLEVDYNKQNVLQRRDHLVGFDFDPNRFYFASNRETDTAALYLYDIEKGEIIKQVASDPNYDLVDIETGAGQLIASRKNQKHVGIHYNAAKPTTIWFEPEYQDLQNEIDTALPGSTNLVVDFDTDETTFIIRAVWSDRPPEHFIYERNDKSLTQVGPNDHPLANSPGSPAQPISFKGSSGQTIHGYFTPGKTDSASPAPLVMLVHGGPWARDSWIYEPFSQCLAHNGYSTLRINYRGSVGYGFEHFISATKNYGWAVQEDIADAREWAIAEGLAAEDKFAVMGFSYGGYAAALAAASQPEAFQAAVCMAGIYDILWESKRLKKRRGKSVAYEMWKRMVGDQWKDREQLKAISPTNLASSIKIPLFIAHGTRDPIAEIAHARMFTQALDEHALEYQFIELEEEGHSLDLPKNQVYLLGKINEFLAKHIR